MNQINRFMMFLGAFLCGWCLLVPQQSYGANTSLPLSPLSVSSIPSITLLTSNGGRVDLRSQNVIAFDRLNSKGYYDVSCP